MSNNIQHSHNPHPQPPNTLNSYPKPGLPHTQSRSRVSTAIVAGADRMIALIEQEKAKVDAHHRTQLSELHARFQQYHVVKEERERVLFQRVRELERRLSDQGTPAPSTTNEGTTQPAPNGSNIAPSTTNSPPNPITHGSGDRTGFSLHADLDSWTIQVLNQLGLRTSTPSYQVPNSLAAALNIVQVDLPSADFIPKLLQYLASHKKALEDWEAKHDMVKKECEELQRKLQQYDTPEQQTPLSSSNHAGLQYPKPGIDILPGGNDAGSNMEDGPTSVHVPNSE